MSFTSVSWLLLTIKHQLETHCSGQIQRIMWNKQRLLAVFEHNIRPTRLCMVASGISTNTTNTKCAAVTRPVERSVMWPFLSCSVSVETSRATRQPSFSAHISLRSSRGSQPGTRGPCDLLQDGGGRVRLIKKMPADLTGFKRSTRTGSGVGFRKPKQTKRRYFHQGQSGECVCVCACSCQ